MHIPDDPLFNEKYYFTPGDTPGFQVWQTRYATIGVLICWDQWYPEAARITSLLGAQVLFYPNATRRPPAAQHEGGGVPAGRASGARLRSCSSVAGSSPVRAAAAWSKAARRSRC